MTGMTANGRALMGAASLAVMALFEVSAPTAAAAQSARNNTITVPAMPLGQAIEQIAAQSGVAIGYDPDAVRNVTSQPVRGATSARKALQEATRGTGVAIIPSADGGLTVVNDIVVTARRDEAETNLLVRQATTSDRNGLGLRNQPRNTQVISAKTIEEQQALTVNDILRNAGGVSAGDITPNGGSSYTVRGFDATGLVNGLTGASGYGVNTGAGQPIANIERVEVLKGPDAILFGFGNLGGNVNVVTKKPSAEERLVVSFDTGSYGLVRGVLDANNAITADKKLSGRVIASAQTMNHNYGGYTGNEDYLFAPSLRYKDRLTDIVIGASLSNTITGVTARTLFDNKTRQIIERDPSVPIYSPDQGLRANSDRFYFDVSRQVVPGVEFVARGMHEQSLLTVRVAPVGYNRAGVLVVSQAGSQQKGKSDALDTFLRLKPQFIAGVKTSFTVGYNYSQGNSTQRAGEYSQILNPPLGANTTVPITPFSPFGPEIFRQEGKQEGVYGQALIEFWKLKILGGIRKNWFETKTQFLAPGTSQAKPQNKDGVSPSVGVILDVTNDISLFANYGRGEQATFTASRDGTLLPNIITTSKEAGVKVDLFGKRATINASYFDIQQDNIIVRDALDPTILAPGPGQVGRGIDLNFAGQLARGWSVLASFTRTKYFLLSTTASTLVVPRQPRDTYSVFSSYRTRITDDVNGGLSVGLYGRSSSFAEYLGQYVVPAARQVDVNGFLSVRGFDLNLGVRNIFNRRNYNTTSVLSYLPVDEPRNVRFTITKRLF